MDSGVGMVVKQALLLKLEGLDVQMQVFLNLLIV